jgi:hypothetical protein
MLALVSTVDLHRESEVAEASWVERSSDVIRLYTKGTFELTKTGFQLRMFAWSVPKSVRASTRR